VIEREREREKDKDRDRTIGSIRIGSQNMIANGNRPNNEATRNGELKAHFIDQQID
jgi:hypothetical protein